MTVEVIAKALGARKTGGGWMARCPAHDDRTPSLSISSGAGDKVLLHCHAGCDQVQVIDALRRQGLWDQRGRHSGGLVHQTRQRENGPLKKTDTDRTHAALQIWQATAPATGTRVETYLRSRGLSLPPPQTLRFHAALKHHSGGVWPAMIALVTRGEDDTPFAIHRTFLARDGVGKAPVEPARMMLGPCRGGAVRLSMSANVLMVGEGIETCLAALQATGNPAWAALSTAGLRTLALPDPVHNVIVLADGDAAGEAAARHCALRWQREGRRVRIARPPPGQDFNDLLTAAAPCDREGWI